MKAVLWLVLAAPFLTGAAVAAPSDKPAFNAVRDAEPPVNTPARLDPSAAHAVDYPSLSRRLNEQGRVSLAIEISDTGRVTSATVVTSSGFERLDLAAAAAVKNWIYIPARNDDRPVASTRRVDIPFHLVEPPPPPPEP